MHVVIPAGGRGSRLWPLTDRVPKPLLPLGTEPILTHIVSRLPREWPVSILVTEALGQAFRRWAAPLASDRSITIYVESADHRGTGPVAAVAEFLEPHGDADDWLLLMGDTIFPFSAEEFVRGAASDRGRIAAYELPSSADARRFGVIELRDDGTINSFEEKPEHPRSRLIFTGCFYIPARLAAMIPTLPVESLTQVGHLVGIFLSNGEVIDSLSVSGDWWDIGTFDAYLAAHQGMLCGQQRLALLQAGNELNEVVYVHPRATVVGSRIRQSIIGAEARVIDSELVNCIIQGDVEVRGRMLRDRLISPETEFIIP